MRETINWTLQYFDHRNLPDAEADIARHFDTLAGIVATGPINFETACCLRYLLTARDAAIRAVRGHAMKDVTDD